MYKQVEWLARFMAIVGGLVLMVLIIMICVSVFGRGMNTLGHSDFLIGLSEGTADALIATGVGPLNGDFELLEAGIAFAIFSFLPITQLYSAHATVDIFTSFFPKQINKGLIAFWELVLSAVIILISARLFEGFIGYYCDGVDCNVQTTFILQFPIWWTYGASFIASAVAALVAAYVGIARLVETFTGRPILIHSAGADH